MARFTPDPNYVAPTSAELKAKVSAIIADAAKGGMTPAWVQRWDGKFILPWNIETGNTYQGSNILIGMVAASRHGSNCFGTFKQWLSVAGSLEFKGLIMPKGTTSYGMIKRGGSVSKIKPGQTVDPKWIVKNEAGEECRKSIYLKAFNVFCLGQMTPEFQAAVAPLVASKQEGLVAEKPEDFKAFVDGLGITFRVGSPSYSPSGDTIQMPPFESFKSVAAWASTIAHEIGHWTGANGRCDRDGVVRFDRFGSDQYSKEEAVAMWFSLLLCNKFGLNSCEREIENRAEYIRGWTKKFQNDPALLEATFKEADKAVKWIFDRQAVTVEDDEVEAAAA